ncbi:MAG: hypothetical protein RIS88_2764 [Pseudomonadota bacterium]
MDLANYLRDVPVRERDVFAAACGTTHNHIRNVAFSGKPCGIELAVRIEQETKGAVRRQDLRPNDWHRIWPELVGRKGAPKAPALKKGA